MRDNNYLKTLLTTIWDKYFSDVPIANVVTIKFGNRSYRQLGAIKSKRGDTSTSSIVLTSHFKEESVPEHVLLTTIAHEIAHYAHGFNSPLPKLYKHPHRGNIVDKELIKRGMKEDLANSKEWLDKNWKTVVGARRRKPRRVRRRFIIFPF